MGRLRAGRPFARASTPARTPAGVCLAAALSISAALCLSPSRASAQGTEPAGGMTPEALVVYGVRGMDGRDMREGLADLERAVQLRPGWKLAERAYAYALVRFGRFREAGRILVTLIGPELAAALEKGEATGSGAAGVVDPEDVMALAIVRGETGAYRESDLLYRAYADIVGETTPDAARAYRRLADMYEASGVPWGDASVEAARALATDPAIESVSTLPRYPDLTSEPGFAPYLRQVSPAGDHEPPEGGFDRLPRLAEWPPPGESPAAVRSGKTAEVELLVGEQGRVIEASVPEDAGLTSTQAAAVENAAAGLRFEPALSGGLPAEAWILFEMDVPAVAAGGDSLDGQDAPGQVRPEPAGPDSVDEEKETNG